MFWAIRIEVSLRSSLVVAGRPLTPKSCLTGKVEPLRPAQAT